MSSSNESIFEGVIGHRSQLTHLELLFSRKCVPHGMMFCGPSGVGKRTTAFSFASALLSSSAAGRSLPETRKLVQSGSHPDLHLARRDDAKKDLTVEQIRELSAALQLKSYFGGSKVAIIDNAHEMNIAASNALLMTLEEPPQNTYLFLITDSPQRLPETIVSRCQLLNFGELSPNETYDILSRRLDKSKQNSSHLRSLAEFAGPTLAPLGLEHFIDSKTLALLESKELDSHLRSLISNSEDLDQQLSPLFSSRRSSDRVTYAASLAATLSANKELLPLVWYRLRVILRKQLRQSDNKQAFSCAESLLASLQAEQLARERNLNPQLQISSLLVKIAECQWNPSAT